MTTARAALLAGASILAGQSPAAAQIAVSLGLGETADAVSGVSSGRTLFLALSRFGADAGASIGAGLPLDGDRSTRWGSAVGWVDAEDAAGPLGLLGGIQAFAYADPVLESAGGAATGDLQAFVPFVAGPVTLRFRGGGRAGALFEESARVSRALGGAGIDATLASGPLLLRGGVEAWAAPESVYPQLSVQAMLSAGTLIVHGRVARWLDDALPETGWSVGLELGLGDRIALTAAAARPETDILFFSPAQRSWSFGLRFGGRPPLPSLPVPVFAEPGQTIRLEVAAVESGRVSIAGTFSGWKPLPMRLVGGRWVAELRLGPGIHEYAFVAEDGSWFVPEGTPGRKPDGFGGFVATIVVR